MMGLCVPAITELRHFLIAKLFYKSTKHNISPPLSDRILIRSNLKMNLID